VRAIALDGREERHDALAGLRLEAAQLTGHSLAVWARHYARSFGKAQRDEHGFGAVDDDVYEAVEAEVR
jgi:hypothetical protein